MTDTASFTHDRDHSELDESDLEQVAGGAGVHMDDDGCELPPGDLPHDQIPTPAPMPTPMDLTGSASTTPGAKRF